MNADNAKLSRTSAGVAVAVCITALFNTVLACVKDAYKPLNGFMNAVAWHNWITQGLADLVLLIVLGLIFSRTEWAQRIAPGRLMACLVASVVTAGAGLFVWYAVF